MVKKNYNDNNDNKNNNDSKILLFVYCSNLGLFKSKALIWAQTEMAVF